MLPKYTVNYIYSKKYIKAIIYFIKKYREESLDILVHETCNFAQKLGPFYILGDASIHKQVKYILNKITTLDQHNAVVLQKFLDTYTKDRNLSKDNSGSLHLSKI
jgi:hypothetical protein